MLPTFVIVLQITKCKMLIKLGDDLRQSLFRQSHWIVETGRDIYFLSLCNVMGWPQPAAKHHWLASPHRGMGERIRRAEARKTPAWRQRQFRTM